MAAGAGLRERKKQQTREAIYDAARRLFQERGFEKVTVAEVARAANVSEVTVFNYYPTKEDLFYAGMQFFEEQLIDAVAGRPRGESALKAFRRRVVEGADNLATRERAEAILRAGRVIGASPSLRAREREIVEEYTRRLAEVLSSTPDDVEALVVASAMMSAHRALVDYIRARVAAGRRGSGLADDFKSQARRVFARLERGLGDYAQG
jgi:AcrR family transcriptional regulator